jgi:hypothetical protein
MTANQYPMRLRTDISASIGRGCCPLDAGNHTMVWPGGACPGGRPFACCARARPVIPTPPIGSIHSAFTSRLPTIMIQRSGDYAATGSSPSGSEATRAFLRHTLATVAYRGSKCVRGAPESFATFRVSDGGRTPVEILAHMGDLFEWALWMAKGKNVWRNATPLPWDQEAHRFFTSLQQFDAHLASGAPLERPAEQLFQAPIADALTHIGQLAMLRRLAGAPIRGENYAMADIAIGVVGADQPPARREFE